MKSSSQVKGCITGILIQIVETGELFDTRTKCAEKLGVTVGAVSMCLNGKAKIASWDTTFISHHRRMN